jgi:hypothetical protein
MNLIINPANELKKSRVSPLIQVRVLLTKHILLFIMEDTLQCVAGDILEIVEKKIRHSTPKPEIGRGPNYSWRTFLPEKTKFPS